MDTATFLSCVLPWEVEGFCSIHWRFVGGRGLQGKTVTTFDEMTSFIEGWTHAPPKPVDLWFCLGRHDGERRRPLMRALKSAWLDVDVEKDPAKDPQGKKYRSVEEAVRAVLRFCKALGIPFPSAVVESGGGIHCYWFSDAALNVEEWEVFAQALKTAAQGQAPGPPSTRGGLACRNRREAPPAPGAAVRRRCDFSSSPKLKPAS